MSPSEKMNQQPKKVCIFCRLFVLLCFCFGFIVCFEAILLNFWLPLRSGLKKKQVNSKYVPKVNTICLPCFPLEGWGGNSWELRMRGSEITGTMPTKRQKGKKCKIIAQMSWHPFSAFAQPTDDTFAEQTHSPYLTSCTGCCNCAWTFACRRGCGRHIANTVCRPP